MTRRRDYVSYLLRLWQTGNEEKAVWRASLENPLTGERRGFASLDELVAFLRASIDKQALAPDDKATNTLLDSGESRRERAHARLVPQDIGTKENSPDSSTLIKKGE